MLLIWGFSVDEAFSKFIESNIVPLDTKPVVGGVLLRSTPLLLCVVDLLDGLQATYRAMAASHHGVGISAA